MTSTTTNKFSPEVRARAVRMVLDHEKDHPSRWAAVVSIAEETGLSLSAALAPLAPVRQAGRKVVLCWTCEADLDLAEFRPGEFEMEWPPRSGRTGRFPEIDRLQYFGVEEALARNLPAQAPLVHEALKIALAP